MNPKKGLNGIIIYENLTNIRISNSSVFDGIPDFVQKQLSSGLVEIIEELMEYESNRNRVGIVQKKYNGTIKNYLKMLENPLKQIDKVRNWYSQ
jgi:hypothetical protein